MQRETILAADDQALARKLMRVSLESSGYRVLLAGDGGEAVSLFEEHRPDLVILDLIMPGMDGLEAVRRIREASIVPIIMLTGVDEEEDKVRAFELGADDYLTKPYGPQELIARVQAVLRRAQRSRLPAPLEAIRFGAIEIIPAERRVLRHGAPLVLTATEYNLLLELIKHAGKTITHEMLLHRVWGPDYGAEAESLRVYVSRLRHKLEDDPARPRHLLTEMGVGYRFERRD